MTNKLFRRWAMRHKRAQLHENVPDKLEPPVSGDACGWGQYLENESPTERDIYIVDDGRGRPRGDVETE